MLSSGKESGILATVAVQHRRSLLISCRLMLSHLKILLQNEASVKHSSCIDYNSTKKNQYARVLMGNTTYVPAQSATHPSTIAASNDQSPVLEDRAPVTELPDTFPRPTSAASSVLNESEVDVFPMATDTNKTSTTPAIPVTSRASTVLHMPSTSRASTILNIPIISPDHSTVSPNVGPSPTPTLSPVPAKVVTKTKSAVTEGLCWWW